ncbi:MAG: hypothetical protein ACYCZO_02385 [Daejeonella sp.]
MKVVKVFLILLVALFCYARGFAQNPTLAKADKEYDLLHYKKAIAPEFYVDSAKRKVAFTTINTDFDEFCPVFYKGGLIITSNRTPGKIKYNPGSDLKPYTDLYIIKDTATIQQLTLKNEIIKPPDMRAMSGKITHSNLKDHTRIGNFYVRSEGFIDGKQNKITPAILLKGVLHSKLNDGPLSFPGDASWVMFTSNSKYSNVGILKDTKGLKLFSSRYPTGSPGNIEKFPYNSDEYSTGHPTLSVDGSTLYFVSDMPGGYGGTDLYYCVRTGNSWSKPVNLGVKVNTKNNEMFPFLDSQKNLYFSTEGLPGLGGLDIFYVELKEYLPFGEVKNLGYPVNSSKDDFGIVATDNGLSGYFSSDRRGNDDIYRFDVERGTRDPESVALALPEPVKSEASLTLKSMAVIPDISKKNSQTKTAELVKNKDGGVKEFNQKGIAIQSQNKNIDETALTVWHQTIPTGTTLKIMHAISGKTVYAKVAGKFIRKGNTKDAIVVLTKAVAVRIGASGKKFPVVINYNDPLEKEEPAKSLSPTLSSEVRPGTGPVNLNSKSISPIISPSISEPQSKPLAQEPIKPVSGSVKASGQPKPAGNNPRNSFHISLPENTALIRKISASDADAGSAFIYSLNGGADVNKFNINSTTGELTFVTPPDFEKPGDADADNTYIAILRASDGTNTTDARIIVAITDVNDTSPTIISDASVLVAENSELVTTIKVANANYKSSLRFSVSAGADAGRFYINSSSGVLKFISPPDYEKPTDADLNNKYVVVVKVSDGSNAAYQTLIITVSNLNDNAPEIKIL